MSSHLAGNPSKFAHAHDEDCGKKKLPNSHRKSSE